MGSNDANEDKYRILVEQASDGIAIYNQQGRIVEANTRASELIGYTREELLALNVSDVIARDDLEDTPLRYEALRSGQPLIGERLLIRKDGSELCVELSARMLSDGRFQVLIRDITERKKLEQEIKRSRDFYLTLLEDFPALVWRSGLDAKCNYFNKTWLNFTGRSLEQELGDGWIDGIHPDDRDHCLETYLGASYAREPFVMEYRLRRHDGEYRWVSDHGAPFSDSDGNFAGYLGSGYDITDQKRADEEIRRLNSDLEQRVSERTSQLQALNRDLQAEIVERKRAEAHNASLLIDNQYQKQRLDNIVGHVPAVVWEASGNPDVETQRINYVSSYVEQMLGYKAEEWLATPNFWLTIVHPDDREAAAAEAARHFEQGYGGSNSFRWIAKDGRVLWVESSDSVVVDDDGKPIGMRGITIDITERKKVQEALSQSEERFRSLIVATTSIVWTTDPTGSLVEPQPSWEEYTGQSWEEHKGNGWVDMIHPDDRRMITEQWIQSVQTHTLYSVSTRLWHAASEEYHFVNVRAVPVFTRDGTLREWTGVITDVHERRQLQEQVRIQAAAIKAQYERLAHVIDEMPVGVFIAQSDPRRRTIVWNLINRVGQEQLGIDMTSDNVLGNRNYEYLWPDGSSIAEEEMPLQATLWKGEAVASTEILLRYRDGRERTFLITSALLSDAPDLREAILVSQDITERKQEEEERLLLLASEHEARQEAEAAVRVRDELLAIVSHDLKNPLAAIKGNSQLLRRRISNAGGPDVLRALMPVLRIDEATKRMNVLLNDLLDFGRLQAGQSLTLQTRPVDLVEMARSVVLEFQHSIDTHDIQFVSSVPSLVGQWDGMRLEQVLDNVISNAIKYSPSRGKITVGITRETPDTGEGDQAVVTVRDEGIGIPPEDVPNIFEWYRRAKAASGRISGAGIGLASAKYIVDQHGGKISVSSVLGKGSTFTVRLPLQMVGNTTAEA
ncbi:MAG: PAS domain S-box protein [Chloroflexota bacterium]